MADYFVQKQESGDYVPSSTEIKHVQETLQLLSVMSGDHRFEDVYNENKEGGPHNMCDVLDRVEQRGVEQGEMKRAKETALNLHSMGMKEDFIAKAVNVSIDLVKQWLGLAPV